MATADAADLYWSYPDRSAYYRKWHIFGDDGRSLCGSWESDERHEPVDFDDPDIEPDRDCLRCARKAGLVDG